MSAEERVRELALNLEFNPPAGNYVPAVTSGSLVFLSGALPSVHPIGKIGVDLGVEEGYAAAWSATVGLLARLRAEIDSLDRVRRVVKVTGFVNATPDFTQHPQVINGASDLLFEVFGDSGKHARAAIGMSSLPLGAPVEVEMIVEIYLPVAH